MDNELKQLSDIAHKILKQSDVGKEYTIEYVQRRLDNALDTHSHDPILLSMAQVINKYAAKGELIISQKELYGVFNHFAGFNGNSLIKEAIGDLLYPVDNAPKATIGTETAFGGRLDGQELNLGVEDNPLENIFDKTSEVQSYYDPTLAKLGKHSLAEELKNMGVPATEIKAFAGNDAAILYDVLFTNKLGSTHIAIPVEVGNGIKTPSVFFNKTEFVDLNADNLNKYIVANAEEAVIPEVKGKGVRTASSVISPSFSFEEDAPKPIQLDRVKMPEAIKDFADFDNAVIEASTHFAPELIKAAKAMCQRELGNMGFGSQIKLSEATDNCIICSAELDSARGKVEIKLPVEIVDNHLQLPSVFYNENDKDKIYDFSQTEISNYLTANKNNDANVMRYGNDFFNMTYNQLKEEMLMGVATKDYMRCEQALNRIQDKFGSDYHLAALNDYSKYLSYASTNAEKPQTKCRLLIRSGSVEPRCGHFNVPISKVFNNERGDCELIERSAKYKNLQESTGALIRSNKITLT